MANSSLQTDVAIIGGCFTGLSAALHLAEKGVKATVVEAKMIGFGGSGRNVGLVNAGMWVKPDDMISTLGPAAGNRLLTLITNVLYNTMLTDMETCYKVMRTEVLRAMTLQSDGFGIEPELTAKIFKRHYRVYEVPITYDGRGYDEGKKITWRDGVVALWVLLKYRFTE